MTDLSVIVAFRNRELIRVSRFFESLKKQQHNSFEVIFIDTGSDLELASQVEKLVRSYSFAKYYYHDTRGKEWNKCEALNLGISLSEGEYLHFTDIDLIYSPNVLDEFRKISDTNKHIYSRVYMTHQEFLDYEHIFDSPPQNIATLSHTSGRGILFVHKSKILTIGGYDTYYSDWGIEDNDMYNRLSNSGLEEGWLDFQICPVFHQWHRSNNDFDRYPDKWLDDMVFHALTQFKSPFKNSMSSKLIPVNTRPILKDIDSNNFDIIDVETTGLIATRTLYYRKIWESLTMNQKKTICIKTPVFSVPVMSFYQRFIFRFCTWILAHSKSPFRIKYVQEIERNSYFLPEKDISWFVRKCLKNTDLISDYYISNDTQYLYFYLKPNE